MSYIKKMCINSMVPCRVWKASLCAMLCVMLCIIFCMEPLMQILGINKMQQVYAAEYKDLDYSLVYDADYYYNCNMDLAEAFGADRVELYKHFIKYGMLEGRIASKNFNVQAYRMYNPDLNEIYGDDYEAYFMHYLLYGHREGRRATGFVFQETDYDCVFDPVYYYNNNADLAQAIGSDSYDLWNHFITHGIFEGRIASEDFNPWDYRDNNDDLNQAYGNRMWEYYYHYVRLGRYEGRISKTTDTIYKGVDYSAIYNKGYYMNNNPDLTELYGDDSKKLIWHFVTYGMDEGRQGDGIFNVFDYQKLNEDINEAYEGDLKECYMHYMNYGRFENRFPATYVHVHEYTEKCRQEATCTKAGKITYICSCGNEYEEVIPAKKHSYVLVNDIDHLTKSLEYRCTECGDIYTVLNNNYTDKSITCWGDSMTLGTYGEGVSYPKVLQQLTGRTTYNLGTNGENSVQIASRQGGIALVVKDNVTVPSGGSVKIQLVMPYNGEKACFDPDYNGVADYSGYNYTSDKTYMCYVGNQAFSLEYDGQDFWLTDSYGAESNSCDSSRYSDTENVVNTDEKDSDKDNSNKENFDKENSAKEYNISAGTRVLPKAAVERAGDILILEIGSNGGWNGDYNRLIEQYRSMLEYADCEEYIILGDTDDPGESADLNQQEFGYSNVICETKWEKALHEAFGEHFLNVRQYLIKNGLNDNGIETDSEDIERAAYGKISLKLRTEHDNTHLSSYGYYSKGVAVYQKGKELGYWN